MFSRAGVRRPSARWRTVKRRRHLGVHAKERPSCERRVCVDLGRDKHLCSCDLFTDANLGVHAHGTKLQSIASFQNFGAIHL